MKTVHIHRMTVETATGDPVRARQLGRRVAELLGETLAAGNVTSRRRLAVDVAEPSGASVDVAAAQVVRAVRARLT